MDQGFDLYSVALAKFLQTVPELGNSIVTFKDVSEELEESEDIKVGIFVLRVGNEIFYVPVISKMDNVYPIDSIYFSSVGKFFPITKKTTEMIITSSKLTQGAPAKIPSTVTLNPDVTKMINPPRTGKFVYASASRLNDFLASMPDYLKKFTIEKVAEEKSVYEDLHKLFSIRDIFSALMPASESMAAETNAAPISVVTGAATNLTSDEIKQILDNGYVVKGESTSTRIAIPAQDYCQGLFTQVSELDGNSDYELVMSNGLSREAFIPSQAFAGSIKPNNRSVALFTNGDYAVSTSFIAVGDSLKRTDVLDVLFKNNPPVLPRDVEVGDTFALINSDAKLIGVFIANKVMLNNLGVEIGVSPITGVPNSVYTINAYRNYGQAAQILGKDLYTPYSSLIIKLGNDITFDLEGSINSAQRKHEISQAGILGDQLNLAFDGVEFSVDGKPIGSEANLMSKLAVDEGIEPTLASSFIKQAKEKRFAKIYLSKKASESFVPGEIPEFGQKLAPPPRVGLNGSFMPNVQNSLRLGDAQTTEATIISELLQAPDMYELIEEYIPDIEDCVDKLGRTLFLSRVHINKLADNNDADGVFAFLASVKAVYRMLGDNLLKLKEMIASKPEVK